MKFNPSPSHTVGVEWELQLLDMESLDLMDGIIPLMEFFPGSTDIKPEFIQSCVELSSCIANNSDEAIEHIRCSLAKTQRRCVDLGMGLCGAGTHPFSRRLALITPLPRYEQMEATVGYSAYTQITFSTHVHVGMESGDQAMCAMSRMIPALPVFIGLSANSPFWRGHETGHAAYRHRILAAARNYGLPPRLENWRQFEKFLDAAVRSDSIRHFKDIHWDLRPHPDFGTLELRVMDAAPDLPSLHGLMAFARSTMIRFSTLSEASVAAVLPLNLPHWIDKENRFRASLSGLDANFIVDDSGRHRPLRELVEDLLEFCEPTAKELDELRGLKIARGLINGTPGYDRQRQFYKQNNSARSVVKYLQGALTNGV